jgi:hypothetical protein
MAELLATKLVGNARFSSSPASVSKISPPDRQPAR